MIKFLIIFAFVAVLTVCATRGRGGYIGDFIQLFAVQTTLLNDTGNDLSPEMKTFYYKALLYAAQAQLVHHQFGQKRPIPKNGGKTIEFRKFTPLKKALTPLTEGVTPAGNQLDVTAITATVSQYGDFISLSDVLELTAIDNVLLETTRLLGDQAGLTMDTVVRNILAAGTNVMYAPKLSAGPGSSETEVTSRSALDGTSVLTVDLVQQVVARLRAVNAPRINGSYVAIIHPYAEYDIMRDPEWIDPHKYKDTTNLYEGEIGMISGVRFVESTEAKIWRGADLCSTSRTLTLGANISGAVTEITYSASGVTIAENELKGRKIMINGVVAEVTGNTASSGTHKITVASTNFGSGTSGTTLIYPGEAGKDGLSVFGTLFFGENAYGVTDVEGGGLQTIVKQKGSAGTADPLDQRSSVGWKAIETAEILMQPYLIRVEHVSSRWSASVEAN